MASETRRAEMSEYVLTRLARADLAEIWFYIAEDSESAADRVQRAILEACELVGKSPFLGGRRADFTDRPVRCWTVPRYSNYIIVYRPDTHPIEIVRVVHGRRNLQRVLRQGA